MSTTLLAALHAEERAIIAELRASVPFQRMEVIHRLLALYGAQPSIALNIGATAPLAEDRPAASVVSISGAAPVSPAAQPAPAIPMPGPVAAVAEAPATEAARPQLMATSMPVADAMPEPASVVSSVRAALLGIGKN